MTIRKIIITFAWLIVSLTAGAQIVLPSPIRAGEAATYSYTDPLVVTPEWTITAGTATINSTWSVGSSHMASITWTAIGSGTVRFSDNGGILDQDNVTIEVGLPTPTHAARCGTGTVTLTATAGMGGSQVRWYSAATKGTYLGSGLSYTTPSISSTTTYYITTYNASPVAESFPRVAITATVNAAAATPTMTAAARCGSGSVTLSGTAGANANTIRWYRTATSDTILHTGTSYSPTVTSTKTFYASSYHTSTQCESSRVTVTATVNPIPGHPGLSPAVVCATGTTLLTATAGTNANTVSWYTPGPGSLLQSNSLTYSPNITATTTYWMQSVNTTTGCVSTHAVRTVTLGTVPDEPENTDSFERIGNGFLTLSAEDAVDYRWYNSSMTTVVGEDAELKLFFSATTSYKVVAVGAEGCESDPLTVTGTVVAWPQITYTGSTYLSGVQTKTLSTTITYTTYQWKKDDVNIPGATSQNYTADEPGVYTVIGGIANGMKAESDPVTIVYTTNAPNGSTISPINDEPGGGVNVRKNFVRTYTARHAGLTSSDFLLENFDKDNVNVATEFLDGLGMPVQTVVKVGSPLEADIVKHTEYDPYGRVLRDYLPYATGTTTDDDGYRYNAKYEQYHFYRDGSPNIPVTGVAYSEQLTESSPVNRVLKQASAGEATRMGTGREVKTDYAAYNSSIDGQVIRWSVNTSGQLVQDGYYAERMLNVSIVKDQNNLQAREYKDQEGRVVLKRVKGDGTDWLKTYYIYDQFGNLRFVLPPECVKNLPGSFVWATHHETYLQPWAYQYKYDGRKRVIEKKFPGAGWTYIIYDKLDRPVLTQNAVQRLSNDWSFTKYDVRNRPVLSGVYTDETAYASLRSTIAASAGYEYKDSGNGNQYTLDNALPEIEEDNVFSITFYDDYELPPFFTSDFDFSAEISCGNSSNRIMVMATASMSRNLADSTWTGLVSYYDIRGRIIQTISKNHKGWFDKVTSRYIDITAKPYQVKETHRVSVNQTTTLRTYTYDHADRPLEIWHQVNSEPEVLLAKHEYSEVGQLVRKHQLSTDNGVSFLQSTDYGYTINGMLSRINEADLSGDFTDQFGMQLFYESGFEQAQHNGNISGVIWKNAQEGAERSYGYVYDNLNRLRVADHTRKNSSTGNWTEETGRYNEVITGYDHNGNITGLERWGLSNPATPSYGKIDELTYSYTGNQLQEVVDASGDEGFKDGVNSGDDYAYDLNGSLTSDLNKGIDTILYNHLGLVSRVQFINGNRLEYAYNAGGSKLRQEVWVSDTLAKATDYIGSFVYENDTLKFFGTEEGRVLLDSVRYQLYIKDYLGNVRSTIGGSSEEFLATMELATRTQEESDFLNLSGSTYNSASLNNHTAGGTYSIRLSGVADEVVGPAKSFEVTAGDYFEMEVYAKYLNTGSGSSGLNTLFTALVGAFSLPASGGSGLNSEAAHDAFGDLFGGGAFIGDVEPYEDEDAPKAFLNYILFDSEFNLVDFGFDQIDEGATTNHDLLSLKLKIEETGYLYVYLSHESTTPKDVFFDDFKIKRTHIDIIHSTDYYAFGMEISGTQYNKPSALKNQYLYNGKEKQDELGLNWQDYGARMYMNDIGRWGCVDPLAEVTYNYSPYTYTYDNPINFVDPDGRLGVGAYGESTAGGSVQIVFSATPIIYGYTFDGKWYGKNQTDALNAAVTAAALRDIKPPGVIVPELKLEIPDPITTLQQGLNQKAKERKQQTQEDRSAIFHFYPESMEFFAYKTMLIDQSFSDHEVGAYLVQKKGTNERGVLVLPWNKNTKYYNDHEQGLSYTDKVIVDHNGVQYVPILFIHTHPDEIYWPSGLDGDMGVVGNLSYRLKSRINGVILTNTQYTPYNSSSYDYVPRSNTGLLSGSESLFKK